MTSEDQSELECKSLEEIGKEEEVKVPFFLSYMNVIKKNIMKKCMIAETRPLNWLKTTIMESLTIENEVDIQQEHKKLALIGKGQWRIC